MQNVCIPERSRLLLLLLFFLCNPVFCWSALVGNKQKNNKKNLLTLDMVLLFLPKVTQICSLPITPSVGGHLRQICNPCVWICSPLGALDKHLCGPRPASQWKQILGKTYISVVLYTGCTGHTSLQQSVQPVTPSVGAQLRQICNPCVWTCSWLGCIFLQSPTCITMQTKDWVYRMYISAVLYLHYNENKRLGGQEVHFCGPLPAPQRKQKPGKAYLSVIFHLHHNEDWVNRTKPR